MVQDREKVDFFTPQCQTEGIDATVFGICDDEDKAEKTPAYVSCEQQDKWCATVVNNSGKAINFTAVDNCVVVYRDNGEMENRCDAMLTNADNLVFVELKDERKNWLSHAIEQLQTTIDVFKSNNDVSKFAHKRAFACNKRHPQFAYSNKELKQKFFQKNGFRLFDEAVITF